MAATIEGCFCVVRSWLGVATNDLNLDSDRTISEHQTTIAPQTHVNRCYQLPSLQLRSELVSKADGVGKPCQYSALA